MNNKAQTTYYIILGIILLFIVAIMSYLLFLREPQIYVPPEIKPVYDNVVSCISDISKNGIHKLGLQGGYINIPPSIKKTPRSNIKLDNTGNTVIPFWYYEGEDRSPTLEFMEQELAVLLKQELANCADFESLKPKFNVKIKDSVEPEVSINEQDVKITVKWPLEITSGDQTKNHEDFIIKHNVKLKQAFDLAKKIMDDENKNKFFEKLTINLISVDPEIPMDGMEFNCGVKKWHLQNIRQRLQQTLNYNIPYIRILNTNYPAFEKNIRDYKSLSKTKDSIYEELNKDKKFSEIKMPADAPEDAFEYFSMTMDVQQSPTTLKAGFLYSPEWGIELNAQPSEGGRLTSNKAKGLRKYMNFLCINQWHFVYDIIYPITTTISDDTAFSNEGFIFQMAFPVLINDNEGERKYFGLKKFQPSIEDAEYCNRRESNFVELRATGFEDNSPVAVPLENVNLTFQCGNEECILGSTTAYKGSYALFTNLPEGCGNPIIKGNKQGYLPGQDYLLSGQNSLDVNLPKLQKMNIEAVKNIYDSDTDILNPTEDLDKSYKLTGNIYLQGTEFSQYFTYPSNNTIELLYGDGIYDINIILTDKQGVLLGGFTADNLEIKFKDIDNKNTIVFHILEQTPVPDGEKGASKVMGILAEQKFINELKPEFK